MGKIDLILPEGRRLLERQLELECVRVENGNTLVPFSCPRPDPPPRLLVARYDGVNAMFLRYDLPSRVRREFEHLSNDSPDRLFEDEQVVKAILILDAPCEAVWRGMAYIAGTTIALGAWRLRGRGAIAGCERDRHCRIRCHPQRSCGLGLLLQPRERFER